MKQEEEEEGRRGEGGWMDGVLKRRGNRRS